MTTKHLTTVLLVAMMTAMFCFVASCQRDSSRVCTRLGEIMDEAGEASEFNEDACVDFVATESERCGNIDAMVSCWVDAADSSAFRQCRALCEAGEEGEEGEEGGE